jgi:hypothetical protein
MAFSSGFSLPGFPGSLGLPGLPPLIEPGTSNDGTGIEPQPTSIQIVNRTMVTSALGAIPPTTAGNTLVAICINGPRPYINSTGTSIGSDQIGGTIYDGTPFWDAAFGPVNQADSSPPPFGSGVTGIGSGIHYLENVAGGITQIQFEPPDSAFNYRVAVYELTPCTFDVAGVASVHHSAGGATTWTGAITPTGVGGIGFSLVFYQQFNTGGVSGASWATDMAAPPWPTNNNGFVGVQNGLGGTTPISIISSGSSTINGGNGIYLACFKPAAYTIALADRRVSFSDSGVLNIRTTEVDDLIVVIAASGASLSGGSDTFISAGSSANGSIWYCLSTGGTSSITFSSAGGILAYELAPPEGFAFSFLDVQTASVSPTSLTLYGSVGTQYAAPVLAGNTGPSVYFVVVDGDGNDLNEFILSQDWKHDDDWIGPPLTSTLATFTQFNQAGQQQLLFYFKQALIGASSYGMVGIALGLVAAGGLVGGGEDLNTFLPNVWIMC